MIVVSSSGCSTALARQDDHLKQVSSKKVQQNNNHFCLKAVKKHLEHSIEIHWL